MKVLFLAVLVSGGDVREADGLVPASAVVGANYEADPVQVVPVVPLAPLPKVVPMAMPSAPAPRVAGVPNMAAPGVTATKKVVTTTTTTTSVPAVTAIQSGPLVMAPAVMWTVEPVKKPRTPVRDLFDRIRSLADR